MNVVQPQVDCSSAKEFLDALSPLGTYFKENKLSDPWMFRGQGQDKPLIPSAFRKDGRLAELTHRNIEDYKQKRLAERDLLTLFFDIADKRGLILPDDSQQLRSILEILRSDRGEHFVGELADWQPDSMVLSLAALAQHYGIPTRLLDWTRHPYIAAFFAAEDALNHTKEYEPSSQLVVWAFLFPALGKHDEDDRRNDPIRIVTAPSATNPNLKAQQGIFTLLNPRYTMEGEGDYIPMEQVLEEQAMKAEPERFSSDKLIADCKLRKFTLPVSEAGQLLYLLAKLDISPSVIYPGYHSIVRDIKMQNLWP
jgi:FRG domain